MCNCINEVCQKLKEKTGYESIEPPVEVCSGRLYLNFTSMTKDGKEVNVPLLLSKCPWCGESIRCD